MTYNKDKDTYNIIYLKNKMKLTNFFTSMQTMSLKGCKNYNRQSTWNEIESKTIQKRGKPIFKRTKSSNKLLLLEVNGVFKNEENNKTAHEYCHSYI